MYTPRHNHSKRDLAARWAWPDRVFFACGACHILAYAYLKRWGRDGDQAVWIKPAKGLGGNHVFVDLGDLVFDFHGFSERDAFLDHYWYRARKALPGWDGELVDLPTEVLISEAKSKTYEGLWLREPKQFHRDALPRAENFLEKYEHAHSSWTDCF